MTARLGRPPRVSQYNIALQREIIRGMTLEAAYVGNRGAWLQGSLYSYNSVTPAILAANGLSLSNSANRTLLNSQIGSSAVKAAGYSLPFSSYPVHQDADQCSAAVPSVRKHQS